MSKKIREDVGYVHVTTDDGDVVVLGPGDEVPSELQGKVGDHVYEGYKAPKRAGFQGVRQLSPAELRHLALTEPAAGPGQVAGEARRAEEAQTQADKDREARAQARKARKEAEKSDAANQVGAPDPAADDDPDGSS